MSELMQYTMEAFVILFVVIDPLGLAPIYFFLSEKEDTEQKRKIALEAVIIANLVLFAFAFVGDFLLAKLHISDPAFRISGGILLFLLAIDMVVVRHSGISTATFEERNEARKKGGLSVFPLAIPLIAGPGELTTVVLLMRKANDSLLLKGALIVVIFSVLLITYACLRFSDRIAAWIGLTGANVISRVLGILLVALSIQLVIDGIKLSFF